MLIAYMLNPQRQTAFLNPLCSFVTIRNAVQLVELLYLRFFPGEAEAEAQAQAKGEAGIADQFIAYINKEPPFDESKYTVILLYVFDICSNSACATRSAWRLLDFMSAVCPSRKNI